MVPSIVFAIIVLAIMAMFALSSIRFGGARDGTLRFAHRAARALRAISASLSKLGIELENAGTPIPDGRKRQFFEIIHLPVNRVWTLAVSRGQKWAVPGIHPEAVGFIGYSASVYPWTLDTDCVLCSVRGSPTSPSASMVVPVRPLTVVK